MQTAGEPNESIGTGISLSVITPVFNNSDTVRELHRRLGRVVEEEGLDCELIFVDDGSTDGSWGLIAELAEADDRVVGIRLARNFGQAPALLAGCEISSGAVIAVMDADLELLPEDLPRLLDAYAEGHDLVTGARPPERHWSRRRPSQFFNWAMNRVSGVSARDLGCGFAVVKRSIVEELFASGDYRRNLMVKPVLIRLSDNWKEVPVGLGTISSSSFGYFSLAMLMFECLFMFGRPFYWTMVGGMVLVLAGLATAAGAAAAALFGLGSGVGPFVAGGVFLAILGFQTLMLGLFANYVVRTLKNQGTPYFQVRTVVR